MISLRRPLAEITSAGHGGAGCHHAVLAQLTPFLLRSGKAYSQGHAFVNFPSGIHESPGSRANPGSKTFKHSSLMYFADEVNLELQIVVNYGRLQITFFSLNRTQ